MTVLSTIVDRLRSNAPILNGRVSKARNLASPEIDALPEAWVGRWIGSPEEGEQANIVRHRVTREIVVQLAVTPEYLDNDEDMYDTVYKEVLSALLGLQIGDNNLPLRFESDTPVSFAENHALWRLIFSYDEYVSEVTT